MFTEPSALPQCYQIWALLSGMMSRARQRGHIIWHGVLRGTEYFHCFWMGVDYMLEGIDWEGKLPDRSSWELEQISGWRRFPSTWITLKHVCMFKHPLLIFILFILRSMARWKDPTQQAFGNETNRDHSYISTYISPTLKGRNLNSAFNLADVNKYSNICIKWMLNLHSYTLT